jgi:toxin CptA
MARRTPAPVWFQTRPSRRLIAYLLVAHALGATGLLLAELALPLRAGLTLTLLFSLARQLWVHAARRGAAAVRAVHWQADGHWRVLDGRGLAQTYETCQVVLAAPELVLVQLRGRAGRRRLLLAADSADAQSLRLLRVRLRRQGGQQNPAQDSPLAGT